jgi:outer membrane lipoprotein-sorting protein
MRMANRRSSGCAGGIRGRRWPALLAVATLAWSAGGGAGRADPAATGTVRRAAGPLFDPATGQPVLDRILAHLDDLYRSDRSIAVLTLEIQKPNRTRTLTLKAWSRGTEQALIVIEKPEREAGTATLRIGRNLWNYLPRIARTIRIPPSMMLSSWMGSDLTHDDLVRESSLLEDFTAALGDRSEDPPGWTLSLKAREDTVGLWNRIEYVVSDGEALPVQARFYDRRDRLSRVMTFSHIRVFDGRRVPSRLELVPTDKEGHKTVVVYDEVRFNADVPESLFSLSSLEKAR